MLSYYMYKPKNAFMTVIKLSVHSFPTHVLPLQMIVPLSFREKHRFGINHRTTDTLKYLRKHSYAPEEQKHARLYEVRALTKSGHEIPAEVHVTSFVIEGELFYTGVISEMTRKTGGSIGSTSDINELSLKQRVSPYCN